MKVFLSYCFDDQVFVQRVSYHLRKQSIPKTYCYSDARPEKGWSLDVGRNLGESNALVLFLGPRLGDTQLAEIQAVLDNRKELAEQGIEYKVVKVVLPGGMKLPKDYIMLNPVATVEVSTADEAGALTCAKRLAGILIGRWTDDDLPIGYPFGYEKDIIAEYSKGALSPERIAQGCPTEWPRVIRRSGAIESKVDTKEIGLYRDWDYQNEKPREEDPQVVVAALADFHTDALVSRRLTFPEAGPRKLLAYPNSGTGGLTVGVMVSGGIAPGINSVIAGIVERQFLYAERGGYKRRLTVRGYRNGLSALFRQGTHHQPLTPEDVRSQANLGGSMLGTSRAHEFMTNNPVKIEEALVRAVNRLDQQGTEILYIVGGDGSMRAAHSLWKKARDIGKNLSVVGIPKTMDNDILWVWQSFGFLSAVEWSKECIQQLHTEAQSNPRLCVIQLFGSDSGFVVTHAVTASGDCDLFLVPEVPFTMKGVADYVTQKLKERYDDSGLESAYGLVVMAETAIPLDAKDYMDDKDVNLTEKEKDEIRSFLVKRRIFGQTPD